MTRTANFSAIQDRGTAEMPEHTASNDIQDPRKTKLIFGVDDKPPIHIALFYGVQVIALFSLDEYRLKWRRV